MYRAALFDAYVLRPGLSQPAVVSSTHTVYSATNLSCKSLRVFTSKIINAHRICMVQCLVQWYSMKITSLNVFSWAHVKLVRNECSICFDPSANYQLHARPFVLHFSSTYNAGNIRSLNSSRVPTPWILPSSPPSPPSLITLRTPRILEFWYTPRTSELRVLKSSSPSNSGENGRGMKQWSSGTWKQLYLVVQKKCFLSLHPHIKHISSLYHTQTTWYKIWFSSKSNGAHCRLKMMCLLKESQEGWSTNLAAELITRVSHVISWNIRIYSILWNSILYSHLQFVLSLQLATGSACLVFKL